MMDAMRQGRRAEEIEICGWSRGRDLNSRPADYESAALPLSYLGLDFFILTSISKECP